MTSKSPATENAIVQLREEPKHKVQLSIVNLPAIIPALEIKPMKK